MSEMILDICKKIVTGNSNKEVMIFAGEIHAICMACSDDYWGEQIRKGRWLVVEKAIIKLKGVK